jgi:hypothetical protein
MDHFIGGAMMPVLKALPHDLIDSLLSDYKKPEDLIGEHGLLRKVFIQKTLFFMLAHL